ncbi:MAG: hypothetical protein HY277_07530 [Ignavibacteriales bacterium]|nr:hypothetical protein [Ignavibacteriales bacterium]
MALIEEEPKHSWKILTFIGIPAFFIAVVLSLMIHQYSHIIINRTVCKSESRTKIVKVVDFQMLEAGCPISSVAGVSSTFVLALASFAFYMKYPRNLFAASMAFVNASTRLPETVTVFLQLVIHNKTHLVVDESSSLSLIHLKDPTIAVIIMCFFSLTVIFLTIIVIHDTKTVPWKWLVALTLFCLLGPVENIFWRLIAPMAA